MADLPNCQTLLLEQVEGVLYVSLNRPESRNAMSLAMVEELRAVLAAVRSDRGVRALVLRGADGHFCAGGDIAEYPAFRFAPESLRAFHEEEVWGGLAAMLACDCPLIAAIDGHCMGAGIEIASCCDIRIATPSSRYGAPIGKLGFPMAPQ